MRRDLGEHFRVAHDSSDILGSFEALDRLLRFGVRLDWLKPRNGGEGAWVPIASQVSGDGKTIVATVDRLGAWTVIDVPPATEVQVSGHATIVTDVR